MLACTSCFICPPSLSTECFICPPTSTSWVQILWNDAYRLIFLK